MHTITMMNKNGRKLREIHGVALPECVDVDTAADLIWLGMAAACTVGHIIITNECNGKEVANKVYIAK